MLEASPQAAPHMHAGAACYQQRDLGAAREHFRAALDVQPDLTPARFNLAVVCRELEDNELAESLFQQVLQSGELIADALNNLGILAMRREAEDLAESLFRRAIEQRPDFPLARFNLSTLLLKRDNWEEGFREYQWRWQTPSFTPIQCPQPLWDGRPLDGTLLVHSEQGIGDTLQFVRFLPLIRQRCRRMIFIRPDHLECLFPSTDRATQSVETGERDQASRWADEVRSAGEIAIDSFDAFLPLMSAPFVLGASPQELPIAENYLTPQPRSVDLPSPPLPQCRLRVGFAWRGSSTHVNDAFRSTCVDSFAPLFQLPGIAFYSLQIGEVAAELKRLEHSDHTVVDLSSMQNDLADTAAIVGQLDLVITVDTAILHLCGALGVPVWGLLSRRSDWRWLGHDKTTSPWYPTLRLFRQRRLNDWNELIGRVADALMVYDNDAA